MIVPHTRKARIFSGISANLIGQILTATIQLIGIPIFLSKWGKEYYGEWLILFTVPSYLGMSDLGLGTVSTTEMAMCVSRGETQRAAKIFRASFWSIMMVGLSTCTLFVITLWALPWHDWLHLRQLQPSETTIALVLLTVYIFEAIVLTLPLGIYRVAGRYGRGQMVSNLFRLAEFLAVLSVVAYGYGVVFAAAAMAIVRFFYVGFVWMEAHRLAPWLHLRPLRWEWPLIRPLAIPSLTMTTTYAGQSLVSQGLVTIIGVTMGASSVVVFSTIRTLCNFARQIIGAINLSVFSEFSISIGNEDLSTARRLHTRTLQANFALTFLAVAGLKLLGGWVLFHWTKGQVNAEEPFFTLYLSYLLLNSLWIGSWNMLLGCNRHKGLTRYFLMSSIIMLVAVYHGIGYFGLSIVPVTLLITDVIFAFFVLKKSALVLQQPVGVFFSDMLATRKIR